MKLFKNSLFKGCYEKEYGKNITVAGWVEDIRNIGSIAFIILRDRKGTLQVTGFKKE